MRYLERIDEAVADYEAAIEIFERSKDRLAVANHQLNMANALYHLGRVKPATEAALAAHGHFIAMKIGRRG